MRPKRTTIAADAVAFVCAGNNQPELLIPGDTKHAMTDWQIIVAATGMRAMKDKAFADEMMEWFDAVSKAAGVRPEAPK